MLSNTDLGPNRSRSDLPIIIRSCRLRVSESYLNCLVWSDLVKRVVSPTFSGMTHSKASKDHFRSFLEMTHPQASKMVKCLDDSLKNVEKHF